jgi:hypothetical protein
MKICATMKLKYDLDHLHLVVKPFVMSWSYELQLCHFVSVCLFCVRPELRTIDSRLEGG